MWGGRRNLEIVDHPIGGEEILVADDSEEEGEEIPKVGSRQVFAGRLLSRTWSRAFGRACLENARQVQSSNEHNKRQKLHLSPKTEQYNEMGLYGGNGGAGTSQPVALECMQVSDGEPRNPDVMNLPNLEHSKCSPPNSSSENGMQHDNQVLAARATEINQSTSKLLSDKRQLGSPGVEYTSSQGGVYVRSRSRAVIVKKASFDVALHRMNRLGVATTLQCDDNVDLDMDTESEDIEESQVQDILIPICKLASGMQTTSDMPSIRCPEESPMITISSAANKVRAQFAARTLHNVHPMSQEEGTETSMDRCLPAVATLTCAGAADEQEQLFFSVQHPPVLDVSNNIGPSLFLVNHKQCEEMRDAEVKKLLQHETTAPGNQRTGNVLRMNVLDRQKASVSSPRIDEPNTPLQGESLKSEKDLKVERDWWNTDISSELLYSSQELREVVAGFQTSVRNSTDVLSNVDVPSGVGFSDGLREPAGTAATTMQNAHAEELHCYESSASFRFMENEAIFCSSEPASNLSPRSMFREEVFEESDQRTGMVAGPSLSTGACDNLVFFNEGVYPTSDVPLQKNNTQSANKPKKAGFDRVGHLYAFDVNQLRHEGAEFSKKSFEGSRRSDQLWQDNPGSGGCCSGNIAKSEPLRDGKRFGLGSVIGRPDYDCTRKHQGLLQNLQPVNEEHGPRFTESQSECHPSTLLGYTEMIAIPGIAFNSSAPRCIGVISHPSAVKCTWITTLGDVIQLGVLSSLDHEASRRTLFIYRTQPAENEDFEFLLWNSFTLYLRCDEDGTADENEQSVVFFENGEGLVMLDYFCLTEAREGSNSAADHEPTGLKILGFNSQGVWLQSVLDCASEMLCISVPQCRTIIAASVNGEVNCWEMDLQWRSHEERFLLPNGNSQAETSTVTQLIAVPGSAHLIVGCYITGSIAIWDYRRRILIRSFQGLQDLARADLLLSVSSAIADATCQVTAKAENASTISDLDLFDERIQMCFLVQNRAVERAPQVKLADKDPEMLTFRYAVLTRDGFRFSSSSNQSVCAARGAGSSAVLGTLDGHISLVETLTGKMVATYFELAGSCITSVAVERNAQVFAVGAHTGEVAVYAKLLR